MQGHAYAAQAEEHAAKGQIDRAAEAHQKAAENYLKAQETTENPEVGSLGPANEGPPGADITTGTARTEVSPLLVIAEASANSRPASK
jgi:hypothetical protein